MGRQYAARDSARPDARALFFRGEQDVARRLSVRPHRSVRDSCNRSGRTPRCRKLGRGPTSCRARWYPAVIPASVGQLPPTQPFSGRSCPNGGRLTADDQLWPEHTASGWKIERETIERAAAGDPVAQRTLYDTHVERIYRLAFRLAGDEDLARDFTQDAFIRAFERLGDFRGESAFGTWLHTIAVSVSLNGLRKVKRIHARETTLDHAETLGSTDRRADPDLRDRLHRSINALPEGYRTVFVLHDVEGYTHEEIGQMLGIQSGTSKAQLFRARARLRETLSDFAGVWSA